MSDMARGMLVWVLLSTLLPSCSGDSDPASGSGGGSGSGATVSNVGSIYVMGPGSADRGRTYATFLRSQDRPQCSSKQLGDCIVTSCGGILPVPGLPDAGTIALTNSRTASRFDLDPWSQGAYSQKSLEGVELTGSDGLNISSPGGADVPAFSIDLAFPNRVRVTSELSLPAGQDATVVWTGGKPGETFFVQAMRYAISCAAPAERGELTIPASAMFTVDGGFLLYTMTSSAQTADTWEITATALSPALTPDRKDAEISVVQQ